MTSLCFPFPLGFDAAVPAVSSAPPVLRVLGFFLWFFRDTMLWSLRSLPSPPLSSVVSAARFLPFVAECAAFERLTVERPLGAGMTIRDGPDPRGIAAVQDKLSGFLYLTSSSPLISVEHPQLHMLRGVVACILLDIAILYVLGKWYQALYDKFQYLRAAFTTLLMIIMYLGAMLATFCYVFTGNVDHFICDRSEFTSRIYV
jgi:hypothetical protein